MLALALQVVFFLLAGSVAAMGSLMTLLLFLEKYMRVAKWAAERSSGWGEKELGVEWRQLRGMQAVGAEGRRHGHSCLPQSRCQRALSISKLLVACYR